MQNELPYEVSEARNLLERAEVETDHVIRTRYFEDAIDALNDYLSDYPETPHKFLIEKLKLTYTRKFLENLSGLLRTDIEIWFYYTKLFLLKVPNEVKSNIENNPTLKEIYKTFIEVWKKEAIEIFSGANNI